MADNTTISTSSPRFRRIAIGGLIVSAFVLYFGLQAAGYPLAGVGAFVVGFGGALALAAASSVSMWDERDDRIHERAAGWTVALFGWIAAVAFPTVVVLEALGAIAWPAWLTPISAFVIVFYLTYAGFQLYDRFVGAE